MQDIRLIKLLLINSNSPLEFFCDPLGDLNVWASTRPINNTAKGHKMGESVVIAAVKVSCPREHSVFLSPRAKVIK